MSWPLICLKDCCAVVGGATPKRNIEIYWNSRDIPWVTPKDISKLSDPILDDAPEYISQEGYDSCSTYLLPKGSILLTSRAPIGNVAIAGRDICTNQGFKSLVPGPDLNNRFLYYWIIANSKTIAGMGRGATFKEISKAIVEDIRIPLPPLAEQKRIADILDKADGIRRKRQQAIDLADEFLRATFLDMFGDPVANPKRFRSGTIRDIVSSAKYGSSAKASVTTGQYPMLRMGNITYAGGWDYKDLKYVDLTEKDQAKYLVEKGDLVFNRTNSKALVGKTAVFDLDFPMAIAGYLIRVRPNEKGNSYYIGGYLNSSHGKSTLVNMCKSIVGMANINAQELQDIKILIPPSAAQDDFEAIVQAVGDTLKKFDLSLDKLNLTFDTISQKAFAGELL